jgi:hypothetical protein
MPKHTGSVNMTLSDGSVRFSLSDLAFVLQRSGQGAAVLALGPLLPVLQATLAGLRSRGVPLCAQRPQAFQGGGVSAVLVLPNTSTGQHVAPGFGFFGVPPGVSMAILSSLLIPAVQKVRAAVDRMPMKFDMRLVMVQDTAVQPAGTDQLALNFEHIRD